MERAGRLLRKLKNPGAQVPPEDLVRATWPVAVGKKLAGRTRLSSLRGSTLVMEVEDAIWQKQLSTLSPQMIRNLERLIGGGIVEAIEFRVGTPRRPPQREERLPEAGADEADGISDFVLRHNYIQSRRRAAR